MLLYSLVEVGAGYSLRIKMFKCGTSKCVLFMYVSMHVHDVYQTALGVCRVVGVSLGLLCVLQATLNISLRLHKTCK